MHAHVALELLRGLSVPFLGFFLVRVQELEEELIVVDIIKIDNGLLVANILPFFQDLGHLFITVGDHPNKSGNEIMKASRRIQIIGVALLSTRNGGFCQGLLKLA